MRDVVVFLVTAAGIPMAFRRPFIGLMLFSWLAYMRPQDLCWGFARDMRFSFFVGITMLVGWWVNESGVRPFWRRDSRTVAMLVLLGLTTISLSLAELSFGDKYVMAYYIEFFKIIMIALFTTGQVDSRQRVRAIYWTIALCLGFYGMKNGAIGILSGGSPIIRGPGGMLEDNNDFALGLVMNIPPLYYLGRAEANPRIRRYTLVAVGLTMVTIILTHSRGGFLALSATLAFMAWRSGKLLQAGLTLGGVAALFFLLAPAHVIDRIATIGEGGAESSAGARLHSWGVALDMIRDHPLLGVGMRNFQHHYMFYSPGFVPGKSFAFVAHNSYLQIWAEGGTLAFVVYWFLLISVFVGCRGLRRLAASRENLAWVGNYSRMVEATTVGFMVGAFFLNRGHFDLIYHWFALLSCLAFVARLEALREPEREDAAAPAAITWRWRAALPSTQAKWGR